MELGMLEYARDIHTYMTLANCALGLGFANLDVGELVKQFIFKVSDFCCRPSADVSCADGMADAWTPRIRISLHFWL